MSRIPGHANPTELYEAALTQVRSLKEKKNSRYRDVWFNDNRMIDLTDRLAGKSGRIRLAEDLFFMDEITFDELLGILTEEASDIANYALFVLAKANYFKELSVSLKASPVEGEKGVLIQKLEEFGIYLGIDRNILGQAFKKIMTKGG